MVRTAHQKGSGYLFSLQLFQIHIPRPPRCHSQCRPFQFRLRAHTLRFETATWNPGSSPTCDLCEADDDVQDEQHAVSTAHTPIQCLFAGDMSPYSQRQEHRSFYFFAPTTNSTFFCMNCFCMSRLAVARFD